ncbi:hypothetical protein OROGR_003499 [Orobanche gracilis]
MSGFSRVSIPDSLQRTIQDIREKTGEHSDEDIYSALKVCNMDPDETAQRLLYIDTFEEVKNKRDRRKVMLTIDHSENKDKYLAMTSSGREGLVGAATVILLIILMVYFPFVDFFHLIFESKWKPTRRKYRKWSCGRRSNARQENGYRGRGTMGRASKSSTPVVQKESNKKTVVASSSHESTDQRSASGTIKDAKANGDTKSRKLSSLRLKQHVDVSHPGPTPTPTPTNPSAARNRITAAGSLSSRLGNSNGSLPVSGMYSSASDPVLVPSLNPRHPGSAGIIKREARLHSRNDNKQSELMEPQGSDRSHLDKPSQLASSTSHQIVSAENKQEICAVPRANGPSEEMLLSKEAGVASDRCSKQAASEIDVKLRTSARRLSVIFPNHLHVPEALKSVLTFGSVDYFLERNNEGSNPRDASVPTNIVPSPTPQPPSSPVSGRADHPESPPHMPVNLASSQENSNSNSSGSDLLRYDQSKLQPPVGRRSHDSSDYGSGLVPPPAAAQSSLAVSPQLFPFYRQQPYTPNYVPYSPYYSQLYMPPQNVSHHSGFPHQASPAAPNIYKFPVPPVYKPGSMTHFGISSGYGMYAGSSSGSGSGAALPTFGLHDISGSDLKENNIMHSNIKQERIYLKHALPANVYYNLPQ